MSFSRVPSSPLGLPVAVQDLVRRRSGRERDVFETRNQPSSTATGANHHLPVDEIDRAIRPDADVRELQVAVQPRRRKAGRASTSGAGSAPRRR